MLYSFLSNWTRHLFLLLATTTIVSQCAHLRRAPTTCNGHPELCGRRYSNVTYIGAHDSFAFSIDALALARDQEVNITTQLNLGVRLLQAQSHMNDGELHFCHTDCILFDGGRVVDYLKEVKTFLDTHPNEVLTLLFTNPEGLSVRNVWKPVFDASGITPLAYVPPSSPSAPPMKYSDWPTLGEMINSGKRVVVFLDTGADRTLVDFILPEFEMIWESPFSVTDPTFPCRVDRIHGPLSVVDHMYLINHSLNKALFGSDTVLSDPQDALNTNNLTSIINHVNGCAQFAAGRAPTFILLDFVNQGAAFEAADQLNGIPRTDTAPGNQTVPTTTGGNNSEGSVRAGIPSSVIVARTLVPALLVLYLM